MTLTARELALIGQDVEADDPSRKRHDPGVIVRVKTYLQFPRITHRTISELTGVSRTIIKRTKAGRLHKRVKPSRALAGAIIEEWGLSAPELWDRIDSWGP
jgi:hypothetical protein